MLPETDKDQPFYSHDDLDSIMDRELNRMYKRLQIKRIIQRTLKGDAVMPIEEVHSSPDGLTVFVKQHEITN